MRRVDIITNVPFWAAARGDASRIRALVAFLAPRTRLRVVLLVERVPPAARAVRSRMNVGGIEVDVVGVPSKTRARALTNLESVFREDPAVVALVEYAHLSWVLDVLPVDTRRFLDTHEIAHERNARFIAAGLPPPSALDEAAEYAVFEHYERVVLIQQEEAQRVAQRLGDERVLVAPHPVRILDTEIRDEARHIGFVGSSYPPNVQGLRWFLDTVWSRPDFAKAVFDVYGDVGRSMNPATLPSNVRCHGVVADLDAAYRTLDIAINPVHVGAGLKIKTVEAIGAGLPLVTTPEGARGVQDLAGEAFLLAPDAPTFAAHLTDLLSSRGRRHELSTAARAAAVARFSPEACFGPLLRAIETAA